METFLLNPCKDLLLFGLLMLLELLLLFFRLLLLQQPEAAATSIVDSASTDFVAAFDLVSQNLWLGHPEVKLHPWLLSSPPQSIHQDHWETSWVHLSWVAPLLMVVVAMLDSFQDTTLPDGPQHCKTTSGDSGPPPPPPQKCFNHHMSTHSGPCWCPYT